MATITRLLLLLSLLVSVSVADPCTEASTPLAGSEFDLSMVQHQLRGIVRIVDACSFSVRGFDMLRGSGDVRWWGANGTDFRNLTSGFVISDEVLNRTYRNDSFTVALLPELSLHRIKVVAVWDVKTESDFGHVVLEKWGLASSPAPAPAPALAIGGGRGGNGTRMDLQPTSLENCRRISKRYRLRWTVNSEDESVDIGLEAAVGSRFYMAFGWGGLMMQEPSMLTADVVIAGFTEEGIPFAEDYYISEYSECSRNKYGKIQGVCPDAIYNGSDPIGSVNNTRLVYGYRRDGVSFIRYRRALVTRDKKYDVPVNKTENMTVIWALGLIQPPDSLRPYYLPQKHGSARFEWYGYLTLNLSAPWNDCVGPLDAEDKEDQDLIIADGKTPLTVVTAPALHYPNPPNPSKVLYINKKEAPLLRVERGVPVTFSIQAGHDVAFYITSDPIGGNATSRNVSEVIYAGGPQAEGVPASPMELTWLPDRKTPDQAYYQSFFETKMGWKIQVVDGGLSDMYNNSVLLDDQQVSFFWTLSDDAISVAVRGEKKSGYIAIGFGGGMVNSFAYVGWMDATGKSHVRSYWIDGRYASSIHPTKENLTDVRCSSENGIITFEFTRPLTPTCSGRIECKNIIDPPTPLRVIWAMGAQWTENQLSEKNMHSVTSGKPMRVLLMHGSGEAEQDLWPVLAVHGFMMFVAWGILLPGGILAARYLKHVKGDGWFQIHVYLQYSGIAIVLLGVLFAAAELRGFYISSVHVKFGITAIVLACAQTVNAYFRPRKSANNDPDSRKRIIWEYIHIITGRGAIVVGIAALITGLRHLGDRYGGESVHGLNWALVVWFVLGALIILYLEYSEVKRRRRDANSFKGSWVLGNEDDDNIDLLPANRTSMEPENIASRQMEVQLEPLSR